MENHGGKMRNQQQRCPKSGPSPLYVRARLEVVSMRLLIVLALAAALHLLGLRANHIPASQFEHRARGTLSRAAPGLAGLESPPDVPKTLDHRCPRWAIGQQTL